LLRLKDRKDGDYHLKPTHEEVITDMARREVRNYRDVPLNLYQIQMKFRDEPRPRGGLLRCREFIMKDAYSFDVDEAAARVSYETMRQAYVRIFDGLGLRYRMVSADSGAMGGSGSAEFQVLVQSGEDVIAVCESCTYAANLEVAHTPAPALAANDGIPPLEQIATPGQRSIEEVSAFLKACADRFLKSLVYVANNELILAIVRGDHELNEIKLARAVGATEVRLASSEEVIKATGAPVGYAGPVGFKGRMFVDPFAAAVPDGICGANQADLHKTHVVFGRDYQATTAELRNVKAGDPCPQCAMPLSLYRGIEAGHIFLLGTHYSAKMGANFLDEKGESRPLVMGCYGIGVSRLIATAVEQHHDDNGICWPMSIAPYQVHIVQVGSEPEVQAAVQRLESELIQRGIEVLTDDREERPGVKFKDADLIGIPLRLTVGKKALAQGAVELKARRETNPKNSELITLADCAQIVAERVRAELQSR
jgi:prolyl-tRNA synthetase